MKVVSRVGTNKVQVGKDVKQEGAASCSQVTKNALNETTQG